MMGMRKRFNGTGLTVETQYAGLFGEFCAQEDEVRFWKEIAGGEEVGGQEELRRQMRRRLRGRMSFLRD